LLEAVRHVREGGCALDPRLTKRLFEYLTPNATAVSLSGAAGLEGAALRALSPREVEVLQLLCHGLRNKQIAARLGVTIGTVKTHLRHIFRKLNVDDRTGAVLAALQVRLREAA
jgi:DNA-binding NarL/FixJ family response regulator